MPYFIIANLEAPSSSGMNSDGEETRVEGEGESSLYTEEFITIHHPVHPKFRNLLLGKGKKLLFVFSSLLFVIGSHRRMHIPTLYYIYPY